LFCDLEIVLIRDRDKALVNCQHVSNRIMRYLRPTYRWVGPSAFPSLSVPSDEFGLL